jgi:hypothetical protein
MVTQELASQELATTTLESKKETWKIASAIVFALHPFYQEEAMRLNRRTGAPNNWYSLTSVRTFEPESATPEKTHRLFPYSSLGHQKETFDH